MPARILMCPPDYFGIHYEINPWMIAAAAKRGGRCPRAVGGLCAVCWSRPAPKSQLLPPVEGLPDMVFTANAAMIYRKIAVMARFRHPERQGEAPYDEAWLRADGFDTRHVPEDLHFEGAGDALFCGDTLFAGYRIRSDARGHQQIGEMLGCRVIPLELVDPYYYHLDTCFCPLAPDVAIYYPAAFDDYGRAALSAHVPQLIEVREEEAQSFACNAVVVGRTVVTNTGCPELHAALRDRRLHAARNAALRVRQSRRQRQVPHPPPRRRRSRRLEARLIWRDRRVGSRRAGRGPRATSPHNRKPETLNPKPETLFPHQLPKLAEQIPAVVRAGGGFGVVLHAEGRQAAVADAFDRVVVQVRVRHFQVGGQRVGRDGEAVVLRGDLDAGRCRGSSPAGSRRGGRT